MVGLKIMDRGFDTWSSAY